MLGIKYDRNAVLFFRHPLLQSHTDQGEKSEGATSALLSLLPVQIWGRKCFTGA